MHRRFQKQNNDQSGFTLVEMLVSIAIFTMVVTMSVGTLLVLIDANGRSQSMQLVMTNLSFALDSMTREVRTGYSWYCGTSASEPTVPSASATQDCANGVGNYVSIIESGSSLTSAFSTRRVTYWFDDDFYGAGHGALLRRLGGNAESGAWIALTGADMAIDTFQLTVEDTDRWSDGSSDVVQPTATIYIKGRAGFDASGFLGVKAKEFSLQTTVTQRTLDI